MMDQVISGPRAGACAYDALTPTSRPPQILHLSRRVRSMSEIEKYLASGQMRGIGPAMAKRIVAAFGEATFDYREASPDRLKEVSGIGPMRASRITAGWAEQKAVRESFMPIVLGPPE